jgi:hypothetical protein
VSRGELSPATSRGVPAARVVRARVREQGANGAEQLPPPPKAMGRLNPLYAYDFTVHEAQPSIH